VSNHPAEAAERLPHTRESLAADLTALGVRPGSTLLVHASMKPVGYVAGGPHAIVLALRDALGPDGTLVVPTHTPDNSDPAEWRNPPVPPGWWSVIREHTPGFDPAVTPSRWMGAIAELVRTWPGAQRSDHPQVSFAALGRLATEVVYGHPRAAMLGPDSPLGKIYGLDGDVLLLGVGHDSNTSLHLAEYRQPTPPTARAGAAVQTPDGGREWVWWEEVDVQEDDFELLGADFEATGKAQIGRVGGALSRLMRQRDLVDFAETWLADNR